MNCKDVQNMLSVYIDNECTIVEKREIDEHLKDCRSCQDELEWLKTVINSMQELDETDVPEGFHEDLMHRVEKIRDNSSRILPFKKRVRPGYSIVAAAFLLIVVFSVFGTHQLIRMSNKSTEMAQEGVLFEQPIEEYTTETTAEKFKDESIQNDREAALRSSEGTGAPRMFSAPEINGDSTEAEVSGYGANDMIMNSIAEPDAIEDADRNMSEYKDEKESAILKEKVTSQENAVADENLSLPSSKLSEAISMILLILFPMFTIVLIFRKQRH